MHLNIRLEDNILQEEIKCRTAEEMIREADRLTDRVKTIDYSYPDFRTAIEVVMLEEKLKCYREIAKGFDSLRLVIDKLN